MTTTKDKATKQAFTCGVAWAAGWLIEAMDYATVAADMLHQAGISMTDLERAGVDEHEMIMFRELKASGDWNG